MFYETGIWPRMTFKSGLSIQDDFPKPCLSLVIGAKLKTTIGG